MKKSLCLLFLCILSCLQVLDAKVYRYRNAKTYKDETKFLAKFAFENEPGALVSLFIDVTTTTANQSLLLITGYDNYFDIIENDDLSCLEKKSLSNITLAIDQEIEPGLYNLITAITIEQGSDRVVYAVLEGCGLEKLTLLKQRIEFYQQDRGQFSAEDSGMIGIYSFFFSFFLLATLVHVYGQVVLSRSMPVHPIYKFLTSSIIFEFFGLMFHLIHYCIYSRNGIGAPGLETLGELFEMVAQVNFVALLLLISQGWTISNDDVPQHISFFIFSGLYSMFYMIYFGVNASIRETPSFNTQYQEATGGLLLAFRCIIFFYFVYCLRRTYRVESSIPKKNLYRRIGILFSLWFIVLPFTIAIVSGTASLFDLKKTTTIALLIYEAFGLIIMVVVLWPSKTYNYFNLGSELGTSDDYPTEKGYQSDKGYGAF